MFRSYNWYEKRNLTLRAHLHWAIAKAKISKNHPKRLKCKRQTSRKISAFAIAIALCKWTLKNRLIDDEDWGINTIVGVFCKWSRSFFEFTEFREFRESEKNHWGMNWVQYKDLLSYNWLCGWVVECLSLTQEVLGFNPVIFLFDLNFFGTEFSEFSESI